MTLQHTDKPSLVGINHVALEVGDIDAAVKFYGNFFQFTLRGQGKGMAFIDMGDQFLALSETEQQNPDRHRHFGLVVDNRKGLKAKLLEHQVELIPGMGLNFRDPWGNFVQVVEYADIQFSKTTAVLHGMELELAKSDEALEQLRAKGML